MKEKEFKIKIRILEFRFSIGNKLKSFCLINNTYGSDFKGPSINAIINLYFFPGIKNYLLIKGY